jgi:hypothetical protein
VQLGEAGGGEGRIWVGAEDSPALGGFAPPPADRQRFLELVQRYRDANPVRGGASGLALGGAGGSESRLEDGRRFCSKCSYQVHGRGGKGGQHTEFATTARPNDRCCSGCPGCTA